MTTVVLPWREISFVVVAAFSSCMSACAVSSEEEMKESADFEMPVERTTTGKADLAWDERDGVYGFEDVSDGSLERMIQDEPVAECTECADDEWGAYVRRCCLTSATGKTCWQEACEKPAEEDLPFDPADPSTRPPSVSIDPVTFPGLSP